MGALLGGGGGSRHGDCLPHRHRSGGHDGRRGLRRCGHGLPRTARRGAELCGDDVLGPARGDEDGGLRGPGSASQSEGADLRGRRHLGPVPWRPDGRGVSPAPHGGAPEAFSQPEGNPLQPGVRVVPARRDRGGGLRAHGLPQRDVRQRLPTHGGHIRPHPGHAEGAVRRGQRRNAAAHNAGHVLRAVPRCAARPGRNRLSKVPKSTGLLDVAIVGVGSTPYYKRGMSLPKTTTELGCEAILAACEDAGLAVTDIDGFAYYSGASAGYTEKMDTADFLETLGIPEVRFTAALTSGGGGSAGAIGLARAGGAAGGPRVVVTLMALQQSNQRPGTVFSAVRAPPDPPVPS